MSTRAYNWQLPASPASSSSSGSGVISQRPAVDPFSGSYPNAPHLRPIALPETGSPMPGYVSPGSSSGHSSSRSRPMSLPPPAGTGLGIYGITSPPGSSYSASGSSATVHPLLRGSGALSAPLRYNVLHAPTTHGAYALRNADGARLTSHDLSVSAMHPSLPTIRVPLLLYPSGSAHPPRRFLWDITLTPSRRASAPPTPSSTVALGDALASLHLSLLVQITEVEHRQFHPHEVQYAYSMCASRRAAHPNSPAALIRADFLYGCTEFAGFVRNADNSFVIRMAPPSAMA